jgi:taurine dioxygenase
MSQIRVRRLGYALGAEVTGVDLNRRLDDATIAEIRRAWLDHLVLCLPGQDVTRKESFAEFTSQFGEIDRTGARKHRDPDNADLVLISNKPVGGKPWDGHKQGQTWHSDQSYTVRPNMGTLALAKEIPSVGGDTMFANQYMAYETLSPAMQRILEGLSAVHDASKTDDLEEMRDQARMKNAPKKVGEAPPREREKDPPVVHPVVVTHPETGRKALFLGDRVRQFVGMTEEESRPLLDFLLAHATGYELTYRHVWRTNDLIMWDNRCLMHLALSDYDLFGEPRHLWRCSLLGPFSGKIYAPDADSAAPALAAAVS